MNPFPWRRFRKSGSAMVAALGVLAVSSIVVGATLQEARNRYRTSHQSGRWSQAAQAAEAGVEMALMSAQDSRWVADGWSAAPGKPGIPAVTRAFPLSTGVPGAVTVNASVAVDKIALGDLKWLRVRSTGEADLAGGAVAGLDKQDILLRKLSLRANRATGVAVATPRATRTLEILAKPVSPFCRAVLSDRQFNMSGGTIDSFDSSDPVKSTSRLFDAAKRQSMGNVGVNDTTGGSSLGGAYVYGNVASSGPAISSTSNVQGTISTSFSDLLEPVTAPTWTSVSATPTRIRRTMSLTGGTKTTPSRFKVSTVDLTAGETLTLTPHSAGAESYVEIWVTGDFITTGSGQIVVKPGVHATYFVEGNITGTGATFSNENKTAEHNLINAVNPPAGNTRAVAFTGSGTIIGAINAPGHSITLNGNLGFSGALIGKTLTFSGGAKLHYDEALGRAELEGGGFKVMSWVESVR